MDFETAELLLDGAGIDPEEELTKFKMVDFAAALLDSGMTPEEVVKACQEVDKEGLVNALLEASHWTEIFVDYEFMTRGLA